MSQISIQLNGKTPHIVKMWFIQYQRFF
jgi:hypothetical protein